MPIIYLVGAIKNMMVGGSRLNTESSCLRLQLFSVWTSLLLQVCPLGIDLRLGATDRRTQCCADFLISVWGTVFYKEREEGLCGSLSFLAAVA